MPEEKGLGKKLLGLFVEVNDDGTPVEGTPAVERAEDGDREKSPAELVAELAGQSAPRKAPGAAGPAAGAAPPPRAVAMPMPAGQVEPAKIDFDAFFRTAGMDAGELDRVRKAEELLRGLPEATPVDVKRQIVEASLKAFGFDLAKIVGAAQGQMKALDGFVRSNEQTTAKAITDAQAEIAKLEDKVISLRADITKRAEQLAATTAAATLRKAQVSQVLEFFNVSAAPAAKP